MARKRVKLFFALLRPRKVELTSFSIEMEFRCDCRGFVIDGGWDPIVFCTAHGKAREEL